MKADTVKPYILGEFDCEGKRDFMAIKQRAIFEFPILKEMDGFDQHSKYHNFDLLTHSLNVANNLTHKDFDPALYTAALLHDIGKMHTQTFDEEGFAHYLGHPAKSAEMAEEILTAKKFEPYEKHRILFYIRHHDDQLSPKISMHCIRKFYRDGGNAFMFRNLLSLMYSDANDHVTTDVILDKMALIHEYLREMPKIERMFEQIDFEERSQA